MKLLLSFLFCALAAGAEDGRVRFEDSGFSIHAPTRILGRPLLMVIDTGSSVTTVDRKFEKFLNGDPIKAQAFTPQGTNLFFHHYREPVKGFLGDAGFIAPSIAVMDLHVLSETTGIVCDGVLGRDSLTNHVLDLAFDEERLLSLKRPASATLT